MTMDIERAGFWDEETKSWIQKQSSDQLQEYQDSISFDLSSPLPDVINAYHKMVTNKNYPLNNSIE